MSAADDDGLGLFDEAASAAGNFPTALRGYERAAVDEYVRNLEARLVATRRQGREIRDELERRQHEQAEREANPPAIDYSQVGGRAGEILRLAQEQAHDLTENAAAEAKRTQELARREADAIRRDAAQHGEQLRSGGIAQIDQLRAQLHEDVRAQVEHARAEAAEITAAAQRQAESLRRQSEHDAQSVRQEAYLDTEELRRAVEREAAEARSQIAVAREQALVELRAVHEEAQGQTAALLADATAHSAESTARLEADIADAARIRAEALAEAETMRVSAASESQARIADAQQEVAALRQRAQEEFSWRKQQLRRETEVLAQRKQALLSQLASLSALAQQTAQTFPDLDDLDADESTRPLGPDERAGDDEDGTILRTAVVEDPSTDGGDQPAVRADEEATASDPTPPGEGDDDDDDGDDDDNDKTEEHRPDDGPTPGSPGPEDTASRELELPPVDGDATIVISAADLPAGTEHLRRRLEGGGPG